MRIFTGVTIAFAISLICTACSESAMHEKAKNPFVANNIQSYEVVKMQIDPSGIEEGGEVIKQAEFDKDGNLLKEVSVDINYTTAHTYIDSQLSQSVMTDGNGAVIHTTKVDYKDNQTIERNFGENDIPSRIRTLYKDTEDRDTLSVYTTADNRLLYRLTSKYDNVGLKESVLYTSDDTTYTKRINGDKAKQVFESTDADGTLVYRETKTYDKNGNEIEFLFEGLTDPDIKDISHRTTVYLNNGLIDNILYYDADGNGVRRELYRYKEFDK